MKQFNNLTTSSLSSVSKKAFGNLFVLLVLVLMVLPLFTTFNEFLTRMVEATSVFKFIERIIVPYEVSLVRTIISAFGVETAPGTVAVVKDGVNYWTFISWNCIGWQSILILLVSLKSGLVRGFTKGSKFEALILALCGTFLMNILRISVILILLDKWGRSPAFFFHDYLSVVVTLFWIIFFWWFSFTFILEHKKLSSHTPVDTNRWL